MMRMVYEARPHGKNKRGRPCLRWEDQVRGAAERRDWQWREVRVAAQDRKEWRRRVNKL